jgi:hypothetical protein
MNSYLCSSHVVTSNKLVVRVELTSTVFKCVRHFIHTVRVNRTQAVLQYDNGFSRWCWVVRHYSITSFSSNLYFPTTSCILQQKNAFPNLHLHYAI